MLLDSEFKKPGRSEVPMSGGDGGNALLVKAVAARVDAKIIHGLDLCGD
jgi:hypothetical protein